MNAPLTIRDHAARTPVSGLPDTPGDPKLRVRPAMLQGPVLGTMLKLAWPTILVLLAQVAVGVAETFYVSYLGTEALAGVALVFPI
jgi:MATE family, multidrug efflux pump